jgi:formate--tetrahydrofolate ligase
MISDIAIARKAKLKKISEVASALGINSDEYEPYGQFKAKLNQSLFDRLEQADNGKLILVTAVNPTPAGEGKTTTAIGLAQALSKIDRNAVLALREPSMGPVFGLKGGATGGGYSQVVPMEDINLHFTGDMHAITAANNLLCAAIDNHLHQGNNLKIDTKHILFKRAVDMNDRALRNVVIGLGGATDGITREDKFNITVASEVMAVLCLSENLQDLKNRLGNILIAYNTEHKPVYARELNIAGAMTALLKDALNPNLVQTLENTPALIHGGPFANIAHGCNSIRATRLAMKLGDYVVTEAGFGSDLGAEKFMDIKCRIAGLEPDCIVLVATIRALKYNGGVQKADFPVENMEALEKGIPNLKVHIQNLQKFGVPVVVAINRFETDTAAEIDYVKKYTKELGCNAIFSEIYEKGGEGGIELAETVVELCKQNNRFHTIYDAGLPIKEKIEIIAREIYRASSIIYTNEAEKNIKDAEMLGYGRTPVCIAKTQYSLSDDPKKLGHPKDFRITIREVSISAGAGFVVAYAGNILTMPGLPKVPAAEQIDVDGQGNITGLF